MACLWVWSGYDLQQHMRIWLEMAVVTSQKGLKNPYFEQISSLIDMYLL